MAKRQKERALLELKSERPWVGDGNVAAEAVVRQNAFQRIRMCSARSPSRKTPVDSPRFHTSSTACPQVIHNTNQRSYPGFPAEWPLCGSRV